MFSPLVALVFSSLFSTVTLVCASPTCRLYYYYDSHVHKCTPCNEICDDARGTPHLCKQQPECYGVSEVSTVISSTPETTKPPISIDVIISVTTILGGILAFVLVIGAVYLYKNKDIALCPPRSNKPTDSREVNAVQVESNVSQSREAIYPSRVVPLPELSPENITLLSAHAPIPDTSTTLRTLDIRN